jgi:hypothetical protein
MTMTVRARAHAVRCVALVALVMILAGVARAAIAQDRVVLSAEPTTRVVSGPDTTERSSLAEDERGKYRVVIVERGGRYYWASRERRELRLVPSGVFLLFVEPNGGGYVKVLDQRKVDSTLRFAGPPLQFFEHVAMGLSTITYWGSAGSFTP